MNILFTIDNHYLDQAMLCIKSILRFPAEGGYEIFILHSTLTAGEMELIRSKTYGAQVQFHFIRVDDSIFDGFPETSRYPKQIYYRILAASWLPEQIDRILYLDPDIIVIRSLEDLYNMDFEDHLLLATTHVNTFLTRVNCLRLNLPKPVPYVNTGVMLMNLTAFREIQNTAEIKTFVKQRGKVMTLPDQDIITALYGERIKLVDTMIYNLSDRMLALYNARHLESKRDLEWVRNHAVILHYCGTNKPWKENYLGILDCFYHEVENM